MAEKPVESILSNPPKPPVTAKRKSVGELTVDVDCSEALTGLKAVQREAKKATAALRELESTQKRFATLHEIPDWYKSGGERP
jgi:hypothetical protein